MYNLQSIFHFLVIICVIHLQWRNADAQESRDALRIEKGSIFIGKDSFHEGNLLFAVCERNTTNLTKCNIVQKKVYPNSQSTYSCFITMKADHDESRLYFNIGIATLGKDKSILFWGEEYNNSSVTKIGTVDLKTCKMNHVTIPDPSKEVLLDLLYTNKIVKNNDDSFDLFFNESERCGNKLCKMQINADGTVKTEPITSNIEGGFVHYVSTIATGSPFKGYVYMKKKTMDYALTLVKVDGTEKQLATYVSTACPTVSASRNVVSACTKPNVESDVICTQYDEDGKIKFTTTIPEIYKNAPSRALNNLADGGILVLLAEMSNCDQRQNCDENKYHMVKIDSKGKYMGYAPIPDFNSTTNQWKHAFVYQYDVSKYCAAIIGQDPVIDNLRLNNFEIIHQCVTEYDFLV